MNEWKPIESAPKDKFILLAKLSAHEDEDTTVTAGFWMEGYPDGVDYMGHDDGFVDHCFQEFFPSRSFGRESYRSTGRQPTHWMPLPEPPKASP